MALSHVILHVVLCNSALHLKSQTALPLQVVITDRIKRQIVNQTFQVVRENGSTATVDFDMPWGGYRAQLALKLPRGSCAANEYFAVLIDQNRSIGITLHEGTPANDVPSLVMGSVPFSFAYVQPLVVVFDKGQKCDAPVGDPLDAGVVTQNDANGYYASIFPNPTLAQHAPFVVAVRMTSPRGDYHYIRLDGRGFGYATSWPSMGRFNIDDAAIGYVSDKPEDTLLCPRMYETITH